jgi:aspartyl-tRNA(Asn)/glutamyl-tRNA(Gln) amidotransferase subunit B
MSGPKLIRGYEVVIGIETHAQLSTASKIFSGSSTAFGAAPNTQASAVDLALPGTLPVMNRGAVERAIRFGLAVSATVAPLSIFARKNYFYPDLPKGYQISQYETPVVQGGEVSIVVGDAKKVIHLTRAHLEEDAGKSLHEDYQGMTGIDLNRAGTPLLEIVTEPDMRSSDEAVAYAKKLHRLVTWHGLCDGNMQEGSFRCDANVSVRKPGAALGTRREIKNLNSFKFLQQAIDFEVQWQIDRLEDGLPIEQATVLFNPDSGETRAMRSKEDAHDYRYFPDPDLPPLVIASDWVEQVRTTTTDSPELAEQKLIVHRSLSHEQAAFATRDRPTFDYVHELLETLTVEDKTPFASRFVKPEEAPFTAADVQDEKIQFGLYQEGLNWLMNDLARRLNSVERGFDACRVSPNQLASIIFREAKGKLLRSHARQVLDALWNGNESFVAGSFEDADRMIDSLVEAKGLKQMSDTSALDAIVDKVIAANAKSVEEFRAGKDKAFNALVGQVMKASGGKANPAQAGELLRKKLSA